MLTDTHIKQIIQECREIGGDGLNNGIHATIPDISVDIVMPPLDFLGVNGNPAIFVNKATFKLLGSVHTNWIVDRTIALKTSLLNQKPIEVIGAIIHELGHAFNVAADIENSEANAYIFEIEVVRQLLKSNNLLSFNCSAGDVQAYFESRLPCYTQGVQSNEYLAILVAEIKSQDGPVPEQNESSKLPTILPAQVSGKRFTLFSHTAVKKSYEGPKFLDYGDFALGHNMQTIPFIKSNL